MVILGVHGSYSTIILVGRAGATPAEFQEEAVLRSVWGALVVVMASLGGAAGAWADTATVTGTVTDAENGEVLRLASVVLEGQRTIVRRSHAKTGEYVIEEVEPGSYQLRCLYVGYHQLERALVITPDMVGRTIEVDLKLEVDPFSVEEITVEDDRIRSDQESLPSVVSLTARTLSTTPAVGEADPLRGLQLLPGVQAATDVSSGLYVRGGGPDQTLIMLDGVTLYNPTHAFGLFSTFNADAIDEVTLYKGAYPAPFGGRLGSVLDVQTRSQRALSSGGRGGVSLISGRAFVEGPTPGGSWFASGRRTYLDPVLNAARKSDPEVPRYHFHDLNAGVTATLNPRTQVSARAFSGRDVLGLEINGTSDLSLRWGNTAGQVGLDHFLSSTLVTSFALSGSRYVSKFNANFFETPFRIDNELSDISFNAGATWTGMQHHTVRGGLTWSRYDLLLRQVFNQQTAFNFDSRPFELAAYVEDHFQWNRKTLIRPGVRLRYFSEGERLLAEPRLSVTRQLTDTVDLKLGGGIYHQQLQLISTEGFSAGDFYLPIDETANPSKSWQAVLGVDWQPSSAYRLAVEGYYTGLEDLVTPDQSAPVDDQRTTTEALFLTRGTGYQAGVEVFAERRLGQLTGFVGYTLGYTRRKFAELNQGERFPAPYDRRSDLSVVLSYPRGPWTYSAAFIYATGRAFTPAAARYALQNPATGEFPDGQLLPAPTNSARLLPYHRLDVKIARSFGLFGTPAEWFVQAFNVYNRRNEWFVEYDTEDPDTEPIVAHMLPVIPSLGIAFQF